MLPVALECGEMGEFVLAKTVCQTFTFGGQFNETLGPRQGDQIE
jgi:hypothetical protein